MAPGTSIDKKLDAAAADKEAKAAKEAREEARANELRRRRHEAEIERRNEIQVGVMANALRHIHRTMQGVGGDAASLAHLAVAAKALEAQPEIEEVETRSEGDDKEDDEEAAEEVTAEAEVEEPYTEYAGERGGGEDAEGADDDLDGMDETVNPSSIVGGRRAAPEEPEAENGKHKRAAPASPNAVNLSVAAGGPGTPVGVTVTFNEGVGLSGLEPNGVDNDMWYALARAMLRDPAVAAGWLLLYTLAGTSSLGRKDRGGQGGGANA